MVNVPEEFKSVVNNNEMTEREYKLQKRRKIVAYSIAVLLVIIAVYLFKYWKVFPYNADRIDIYKYNTLNPSEVKGEDLVVSLTGRSISTAISAINSSEKMDSAARSVRTPDFIIKVVYRTGTVRTSELWIDDTLGEASWSKDATGNTYYKISESSANKLRELIFKK